MKKWKGEESFSITEDNAYIHKATFGKITEAPEVGEQDEEESDDEDGMMIVMRRRRMPFTGMLKSVG